MGKESKLRNRYQPGENRQQYSNGDRKLYDKNACPSGCDEEIWHLALYFTELAESHGWSVEGIPIVYTEIYHRVSRDADLTAILNPAKLGGKGEESVTIYPHETVLRYICPRCAAPVGENCYGARETRNGQPWRRESAHMERHQEAHRQQGDNRGNLSFLIGTKVLEEMIEYYYDNYSSNKLPSVNDFCNYNNFNNIKQTIIKKKILDTLFITGTRKTVEEHPITANRRTEEEQETLNITLRSYTQEELEEKLKKFKEGNELR